MHRNSDTVSTKQQRIAALAKQSPQMGFTSLAHLMDLDWLQEAYRRTRKDGAVGVDGQTAAAYEQDLESNLQSLLERAKSGTYNAPPVRRRYIPKASTPTEHRPIGVPTLEDKILQGAVVMLLEPLYVAAGLQNSARQAFQSACTKLRWAPTQIQHSGSMVIARFKSHNRVRELLSEVGLRPSTIDADACVRHAVEVASGKREP